VSIYRCSRHRRELRVVHSWRATPGHFSRALKSRRGERFKNVARSGIVPFLVSIWCSWLCVSYLVGDLDLFRSAVLVFRADLIITAWYAFIVLFVYL
jgi:hypothetical protein